MKNQLITQTQKQIKSDGVKSQSGMATALLMAIIAVFVLFVAAGVYAVKNRQIWIAHGITAAMNAVINNSELPSQEKSQVTEIIYQINQGYKYCGFNNCLKESSTLQVDFFNGSPAPAISISIRKKPLHPNSNPSQGLLYGIRSRMTSMCITQMFICIPISNSLQI